MVEYLLCATTDFYTDKHGYNITTLETNPSSIVGKIVFNENYSLAKDMETLIKTGRLRIETAGFTKGNGEFIFKEFIIKDNPII